MADDYDSPWKEAIERYFADFMAFYFPQAHAQIDWAQPLSFLDQELRAAMREAELGKRVVDKLVRVTRLGGSEEWVTSTSRFRAGHRQALPSGCSFITAVCSTATASLSPVSRY